MILNDFLNNFKFQMILRTYHVFGCTHISNSTVNLHTPDYRLHSATAAATEMIIEKLKEI